MGRQPCCDKIGLKRGPWTIEEDRKLVHFILNNGIQCWRLVPKLAGLMRCGKSCRLRWINYLRPDLKRGAFTDAEEDMIIQLHSRYGNRWSKIASHFPGRTDNEIKNYWNTRIKKKLKHLGVESVDPITHVPVMEPENMNNDKKETSETSSSKDQQSKSTELDSHDDDGDQISKRDGVTEVGQCEQINSFHNTELWENTNLKQAATNEFSVGITGQTFDDFYEQWMCSSNDMLPWDSFSNFDEIFLNISPNLDGAHL